MLNLKIAYSPLIHLIFIQIENSFLFKKQISPTLVQLS